MHDFNMAGASDCPSKRKRIEGGGILLESAKEMGETMFQTLVTTANHDELNRLDKATNSCQNRRERQNEAL